MNKSSHFTRSPLLMPDVIAWTRLRSLEQWSATDGLKFQVRGFVFSHD